MNTGMLKWCIMVQLRRGNPALPPRAKVGSAQRRLDAAFAVAKTALSGDPKEWAARQILDERRGGDPLLRDLADRLARAIWHEQPDEVKADAWFHLYIRTNPVAEHGVSPKNWEDIFPLDAVTRPFSVKLSPFRRSMLQYGAEIDGSYELRDDFIVPTPCLTGRAVRLVNRIAHLNLPLPVYRGNEYEGGRGLLDLAFLRLCLLRRSAEHSAKTAEFIGKKLVKRSITSGRIYGPGIRGSALAWETKPRILNLELDPRVTAGADPEIVDTAVAALCRAIA